MKETYITAAITRIEKDLDYLRSWINERIADDAMSAAADAICTTADCPHDDEYLTARQVQDLLHISESTFYAWLSSGQLAPGRRFGARSRRWTRADLEGATTPPMF